MRTVLLAVLLGLVTACGTPPQPAGAELAGRGERYGVTVALDPAGTGVIETEIRADGPVTAVALSAVMPAMGHAMPEISAVPAEPGRFLARGELFAMPGMYELTVRLDGAAGPDVVTLGVVIER
jgi:hypothetical protein